MKRKQRRRYKRHERVDDDSQTNPAYDVKIVGGRAIPTNAAIAAADEYAKQARERRNGDG